MHYHVLTLFPEMIEQGMGTTGYGAGTDPADCNEHPGFFNQ